MNGSAEHAWIEELPAAVTVTAADGTIVAMNARSIETFASDGGAALIGRNIFDCHPEPARSRMRTMYKEEQSNHYIITKNGRLKVIHQMPWYRNGAFAGLVELSIPIPGELPHFNRDQPASGSS